MANNGPESAGKGLRRWGGGLFWLGIITGIISVVAIVVSLGSISTDGVETQTDGVVSAEAGVLQTMVIVDGGASDCVVTNTSGQTLTLQSMGAQDGAEVVQFTPDSSDGLTINCTNGASFFFIDAGMLSGFGGIALGGLGIVIAGFLVILGAILWFVGRSKRKSALMSANQSNEQFTGGDYNRGGYDTTQGSNYNDNGNNNGGPYAPPPPSQS